MKRTELDEARLKVAVQVAALLLSCLPWVGCGGDSPTRPTPQATLTPTPTPAPRACDGLVLMGAMADRQGEVPTSGLSHPAADLADARVTIADCRVTLTITFAAGTFSRDVTQWQVSLDTDENPATGFSGRDALHSDAAAMGADFFVENTTDPSRAEVISFSPSGGSGGVDGGVPVTIDGDQVRVEVPLAMLGDDDGRFIFSITVSNRLSQGGFSVVLDYLPDRGADLPRTR
jgi:hypothetical protein